MIFLRTANFLLLVLFVFSAGCTPIQLHRIDSGKLATDGIRIVAEDDSFTISSGEIFKSPYQNAQFLASSVGTASNTDPWSQAGGSPTPEYLKTDDQNAVTAGRQYVFQRNRSIVTQSDVALQAGAKAVRIHLPSLRQPLYGVLFLGMGISDSPDLAAKSYLIRLPDKYVQEALNGRVSVVYEEQRTNLPIRKVPTWILWMSDQRFY